MYGTIMHGALRPEDRAAFVAALSEGESVPVPGFLHSHVMFPDQGGDDVWLAVFFTDKASYVRNAEDPAQHARYVKFRAFLQADPTWTDGEWQSFEPNGG